MKVAITGATGFVGRSLVAQLAESGNTMKCWHRPGSDLSQLESFSGQIDWVQGELADGDSAATLVSDCDAVVHSGLWRSSMSFQTNDINVVEYARVNILGTLELIEAAISANVKRFVFVSTCAVHDHILNDRPLDESHPLWANSHYGAHKAAIEKFVHSYGLGNGFSICAIRPTGIYGVARPVERSKWYSLVMDIAKGNDVEVSRGGKEVHVEDVASAIQILLNANGAVSGGVASDDVASDDVASDDVATDGVVSVDVMADRIAGQAFSCYDRYISEFDVATIAQRICGSTSKIIGEQKRPKHEIDSSKLKALGMMFGGQARLEQTVAELLAHVK